MKNAISGFWTTVFTVHTFPVNTSAQNGVDQLVKVICTQLSRQLYTNHLAHSSPHKSTKCPFAPGLFILKPVAIQPSGTQPQTKTEVDDALEYESAKNHMTGEFIIKDTENHSFPVNAHVHMQQETITFILKRL